MLLSLLYVLISGIALPIGGIQMQYLWRNQLGDVYSLGLGSAACLGAAAATMSGACSLTVGSFFCTLVCTTICFFITFAGLPPLPGWKVRHRQLQEDESGDRCRPW